MVGVAVWMQGMVGEACDGGGAWASCGVRWAT